MTDQNLERRLRYALEKEGYKLHKSRTRRIHAHDLGGYRIVDVRLNACIAGPDFQLELDDVADFVKELQG
ncbi:MAG: hypothetical protein IKB65_07015 [Ruminiclostridium sp.]|nr:hypothetical protein [Ruminiclostridium sp.]